MAMTSKPGLSRHNGWGKDGPDQRNLKWVDPTWKWCRWFFDWQGGIHYEFVPRGQTVNTFYVAVLKRLREAVRRKRPQWWTNQSSVLHHDNAQAHSFLVRNFLPKNEGCTPGSLLLSFRSSGLFLFPKLKSTLKGRRFDTTDEIKHIRRMSCSPFRKRSEVGRNFGSIVLLVKKLLWRRKTYVVPINTVKLLLQQFILLFIIPCILMDW